MRPVYVRLWVRTLQWLEGTGRRRVILNGGSKDINTDALLDMTVFHQLIKSTANTKLHSLLHTSLTNLPSTRYKPHSRCSSPSSPSSLCLPLPLQLPSLPPTAQLHRLLTQVALVLSRGRLVQHSPSLEELRTWLVQLSDSSLLVVLLWYVFGHLDMMRSFSLTPD